jgi:hypothetical protein
MPMPHTPGQSSARRSSEKEPNSKNEPSPLLFPPAVIYKPIHVRAGPIQSKNSAIAKKSPSGN